MTDNFNTVIKMSYGWFQDNPCTRESLTSFVQNMISIHPGIDGDRLYLELERIHTVRIIDSSSILEDHSDHIEWFNPSSNTGLKRDIEWHFWDHFSDYIAFGKNWPKAIRNSIDRVTGRILSNLEDPYREGPWDRRGMVMGSVQSGKTANYTGLIAKALDAGYKFIIVLTGTHESLRSQTQSRLNMEILGYDMGRIEQYTGQAESIGVRRFFRNHNKVLTLTSSHEKGDFNKTIANQAGMIPSATGAPIILVVKKNVKILDNLIRWSTSISGIPDEKGQRHVPDVPMLVIDDECDYASVNTRKVIRDENGIVDEDCDPARTNEMIRRLLVAFDKSAYIGYTATPFANIFIHHQDRHPVLGEDLFPRDFIMTLEQPSNYIGAEYVFGLIGDTEVEKVEKSVSPLVRYIADSDDIIPPKHKKDLIVPRLPGSLIEAIKSFLIASAVRRIRKVKPAHNSMLIHVTRFTDVQRQIHYLVESELRRQVNRLRTRNDPLADYHKLWTDDFLQTTDQLKSGMNEYYHKWDAVLESLYIVARYINVRTVNGTARDSLDYRECELASEARLARGEAVSWEESGFSVIAIGGDKLSRGLTLDGLTTTYYLRASRMYDTLMQMGRWFGYRDRYEDVCRIYTTEELADWYRFIASASLELRAELDYMDLIRETPKNFGLKVREHPGQLAVTSAGKRRNAEKLNLSFSGRISETIVFDLGQCSTNRNALAHLVDHLDKQATAVQETRESVLHWTNVPVDSVLDFLNKYQTDMNTARIVNPLHIAKFIDKQQGYGSNDLTTWDVAVLSRSNRPKKTISCNGIRIGCFFRRAHHITGSSVAIPRLVSPPDEWIDFSTEEKKAAIRKWHDLLAEKGKQPPTRASIPSGPAIRAARPKKRGLLLIYPICGEDSHGNKYGFKEGEDVIGFAVSFPGSTTTKQVKYQVNSVFQDAEI